MVKSHRSKRHHKKHRGGEGEATDNNSVLNMDEAPVSAPVTATATPATPAVATATAEEEKKGWFSSLFGGSRTKRVRFRTTRKSKRSSAKRSTTKSKRSSAKRSTRKRRTSKRKGSSRK